jgi:hypothetical protein
MLLPGMIIQEVNRVIQKHTEERRRQFPDQVKRSYKTE